MFEMRMYSKVPYLDLEMIHTVLGYTSTYLRYSR